uniref:Peptidase S1 domain-containing protein n=1 Tax=Athene cunicularia TaxID=194338 RepID=A0A663M220_ATHCN
VSSQHRPAVCFLPLLLLTQGTCWLWSLAADDDTSHMVGGRGALPGAWPWIVSIQDPWAAGTGGLLGCAARGWAPSEPSPHLPSRHITMWRVVVGATRLTQLGPEAQVRNIKWLLVHPHYSNISKRNDVALLELDQPVQCGYYVQLGPRPDRRESPVRCLSRCKAKPQGMGSPRQGRRSGNELPGINSFLCSQPQDQWMSCGRPGSASSTSTSATAGGAVHPHNLCAGSPQGRIDTCQGGARDRAAHSGTGSPLQLPRHPLAQALLGQSWGRGCARAKRPRVYISTQHFYNWILEQMGLHSAARAAPTSQAWRPFLTTSTPFQRPSPTPAQPGRFSSCPFPLQKLLQFFTLLLGHSLPADPKAASVPEACSILPTLL